jgi:predicted TIM-barrel fold metal-dependent hydrolase
MDRIIDSHCFIGRWADRDVSSDASTLLRMMRRNQIAMSVVMTTNRGKNDYVRRLVEAHSSKFLFAFWYDPRKPRNLDKLRVLHEAGSVVLVKIHPSHVKTRLDDQSMEPVLKFCESVGLPVLVHCGRWLEMSGYRIALGVAERFTRLPLLLAHMGGVTRELRTATISEVARRKIRNVFLVTSGPVSDAHGHDQLYAPETCPPEILEDAVARVGSHRVIFGSDYPFGRQDQILKCVQMAKIGESAQRDIVFRNAERLFLRARGRKGDGSRLS